MREESQLLKRSAQDLKYRAHGLMRLGVVPLIITV